MDSPLPGDAPGEKRRATLRRGAAFQTEAAGHAPFTHGGRTGEGAP